MSLPTTDRTKLNNLSPNLVPQQIAVSALRLAVFQEIYTVLDNIITDLNAAQATGAVTTPKLADGSVSTLKLADNAVTGAKLLDAAVIASKLADGSVTTQKVGDGAVVSIKLADGAVATAKIADLNVTSGKIADNAVISVKLADGAVLSAKIADGAVTSLKIADGGVTGAKIADNTITTQKLVDSIITAAKILDGSVTNAKLAPGSVTGDKVANGAINSQHIDAALLASAASLSTVAEFEKLRADNAISPEQFTGTDAQKVQQALDNAVQTQRAVRFTKMYDITGQGALLINKQALDRNVLFLYGSGGGIKKDDAGAMFTSTVADVGDINVEGLRFLSVEGAGTIVWDCDKIIRIKSNKCDYRNVDTVASSPTRWAQSCHFISDHITGGSSWAFESKQWLDCTIKDCLIEQRQNAIRNTESTTLPNASLRIIGNVIEGLTGMAIQIGVLNRCTISDNYFEANAVGDLDMATLMPLGSAHVGSDISNNRTKLPNSRLNRNVGLRVPLKAYVVGDLITSDTLTPHVYRCITAGTTGGSTPTYPVTPGSTVTDGTVVWQEDGTSVGVAAIIVGNIAESSTGTTNPTARISSTFRNNSSDGELYLKSGTGVLTSSGDFYGKNNLLATNRIIILTGVNRVATPSPAVIPDNRASGITKGFRVIQNVTFTANEQKLVTISVNNQQYDAPVKKEDMIAVYCSPCDNVQVLSHEVVDGSGGVGQVKVLLKNLSAGSLTVEVTLSIFKIYV